MNISIKKMVQGALLTAISIIIPVVFGSFLRIYIPPFSATLGAHVPMFLAMFLGTFVATFVGIGSGIGFLFAFPDPVIAFRAFTHIIVGFVGAKLVQKNIKFRYVTLITAPLHGILEALVVLPFGFAFKDALIVVGIGAILHHTLDGVVSYPIIKKLGLAKKESLKSAEVDCKEIA